MEITLKKLELINFRQVTGSFDFDPDQNLFKGKNGTGKTTLYDAEEWVRTGKDSLGSAIFSIKTIVDKVAVSKSQHSVIAHYNVDGTPLKLERHYAEKWTKTRGQLEAEKDGHKTEYCIDDGPKVIKKVYEQKIKEVFPENYSLCTKMGFFAGMEWKERREIISKMVGDLDKEKIIDAITGLRDFLSGKTIEERKIIADQRKSAVNKELGSIPVLIKEHKNHISTATKSSISKDEANKNVDKARSAIKIAETKIKNFENGNKSGDIEQINKLNQDLIAETSSFNSRKRDETLKRGNRLDKISAIQNANKNIDLRIQRLDSDIQGLKTEYKNVAASVFGKSHNECRFCGEVIECGHCTESEDDAEKTFNSNRSNRLEQIQKSGEELVNTKKDQIIEISKNEKEEQELLKVKDDPILKVELSPLMAELKSKIEELEKDKPEDQDIPEELTYELLAAEKELEDAQGVVSVFTMSENSDLRVKELEDKLVNMKVEFGKIESFLHKYDEYQRLVADETVAPVNALFEYINFRMFTIQENGALAPCCDILNDEFKPYYTAMSNGERMRADIDVIKTMSKIHQLFGPVFVDNSESLTMPFELNSQVIKLEASPTHKKLTQM